MKARSDNPVTEKDVRKVELEKLERELADLRQIERENALRLLPRWR